MGTLNYGVAYRNIHPSIHEIEFHVSDDGTKCFYRTVEQISLFEQYAFIKSCKA